MAKKQEGSAKKAKAAPRAKSKPAKTDNGTLFPAAPAEPKKRAAKKEAPPARELTSDLIGETAGDVWRVLAENGGQTLAGLKKSVSASEDQVLLALGWLAREDKLAFETNGRTISVSLR